MEKSEKGTLFAPLQAVEQLMLEERGESRIHNIRHGHQFSLPAHPDLASGCVPTEWKKMTPLVCYIFLMKKEMTQRDSMSRDRSAPECHAFPKGHFTRGRESNK